MKVVERIEDMSRRGRLRLIQQDDGDIIVAVQSMHDGLLEPGDSVEFCTGFGGGGKSPHTFNALHALMEAIRKDNLEHPSKKPTDNLWELSE
jgi:uncharacterized protein (DUF849 family)